MGDSLSVHVTSQFTRAALRLAAAGVAAAALAAAAGSALERSRFGATDDATVSRVQQELQGRFDAAAAALQGRAERIARRRDLIRASARDVAAARQLFQLLDSELADDERIAGITVYASTGLPLAWSGRVSDIAPDRIGGPGTRFLALGALGPRLIQVAPVLDADRPAGPRLATVVTEQLVNPATGLPPTLGDTFVLSTSLVDVAVRATPASSPAESAYVFAIRGADGQTVVDAEVAAADLAAVRQQFRAVTRAIVLAIVALSILLGAAPLLDVRVRTRRRRVFIACTAALIVLMVVARLILRLAAAPFVVPALATPVELIPDGLLGLGLVWLAVDTLDRQRTTGSRLFVASDTVTAAWRGLAYVVSGAAASTLLVWYEYVLQSIAAQSTLDLRHFSLHPLDLTRLGLAFGLVLLHAAVLWGAAALTRVPAVAWRSARTTAIRQAAVGGWLVGVVLVVVMARRLGGLPAVPLVVAAAAAGLGALLLARPRGRVRRASQAARLTAMYMALLVPAVAMYPSVHAFSGAEKEQLIASEFAPQTASQREDLQVERLPHALEAIDALSTLRSFVTSSSEDAAPTTERAFIVWSQTELATYRMTSAVELYGANGRLVSRFALILPEYSTTTFSGGSCADWDVSEEASPFGSSLRYVLRASRAICADRRRVGGIVVRVMLDYRTLPFISTQSPYLESLSPVRQAPAEGAFGRDVEFVFYGWSRAPIYNSGTGVWPLSDSVFERMTASREPFWDEVTRGDTAFRVYYFNDRGGIYALGYPVITWFGHLVNLGELVFLTAVVYVLLLIAVTIFNVLTSHRTTGGRALLREVRSSFYRKLFIAFVASAVLPVIFLAVATRAYFASQFRADIEDAAVKTATVAQRLVEDYATLQQRGANALDFVDDQFMVLVRRAIDQDVNLFDGGRLQATSERDLFASGLLPSRTPGTVYRRIALDRLPTFVGVEEVGGSPYLLAAAPVRTGGREGIVTVPQPLRQQDIEEQRDELDRRVLSASVLFVLLGAGLGYWMAERIGDPVSRLTRATRRIARGDLDARIAATSSDELGRLVADFNRMADDLKRQRTELERTQRLEAWADMARQVAHDIKNPLTPIQLSAEHARRVNLDRGRPLSPVLDECVASILSQVKLLRQISAEFSSFASSPTPRPEPTHVEQLIEEVVAPYRTGLSGRIVVDVRTDGLLPVVAIDRTLFARALTNVIENALHAMPGGGTLTLTSFIQSEGGPVIVEVSDTGVGMDQEALRKIFEPYFSTKATGTGLGLTIAKRNIELSGGTIAVSSTRGVGTTVTMTLPST